MVSAYGPSEDFQDAGQQRLRAERLRQLILERLPGVDEGKMELRELRIPDLSLTGWGQPRWQSIFHWQGVYHTGGHPRSFDIATEGELALIELSLQPKNRR